MKRTRILCGAIAAAFTTFTNFTAYATDDAISKAEEADKASGIKAPGMLETKAIAEEGFIYGLPIVMNYAVMQEFSVDKSSDQFKAPFNTV